MDRLVIAIDGPSGTGKSSTSREVARRLRLGYLDTGAMYRAVTVAFLDAGVRPDDRENVIATTLRSTIEVSLDPDERWVRIDGRDVTRQIREPRTSAHVSAVSTLPECRAELVSRQRALIEGAPTGVVAEGRDITTVVAPDADVRILLTASPAARLGRRRRELGASVGEDQLHDLVLRRDAADSQLVEFSTPADGVTLLDTSDLTFDQVVDAVVALAEEARR